MPLDYGSVEILLSLYKPNPEYLKHQLESLNIQTYSNISLLIRNDENNLDKPDREEQLREIISQCITNFPYRIIDTNENIGYVKSFERLTYEANSDFVSYCDQDDIWAPNKIEKSLMYMLENKAVIVGTDYSLIDGSGKEICESWRHSQNTENTNWKTGEDITEKSLFRNYIAGFTMITYTKLAKKYIPFSAHTGHDHWLPTCISMEGTAANCDEVLASWRRTGDNASGNFWRDTSSKDNYRKKWVEPQLLTIEDFLERFPDYPEKDDVRAFINARMHGELLKLWKYRSLSPKAALGEICISLMPDIVIKWYASKQSKRYYDQYHYSGI